MHMKRQNYANKIGSCGVPAMNETLSTNCAKCVVCKKYSLLMTNLGRIWALKGSKIHNHAS